MIQITLVQINPEIPFQSTLLPLLSLERREKILKYKNPDDDHTDELEKLREQCFITDTKARKIWK